MISIFISTRTAAGESNVKDQVTSCAINFSMITSAVEGTNKFMMNMASLESSCENFFTCGRQNVKRWVENAIPSRIEMTSRVFLAHIREGSESVFTKVFSDSLKKAFQDILRDCVKLCGYDSISYALVTELILFGLRGTLKATMNSLYNTCSNSSSIQDRCNGFVISMRELSNYMNSFYSGSRYFTSRIKFCSRLEVAMGRPMLNPYCPFIITLLKEKGDKLYNSMLYNLDMVTVTERMLMTLKLSETSINHLKTPQTGTKNRLDALVCKHCFALFAKDSVSADWPIHPCTVAVIMRNKEDLLELNNTIVTNYVHSARSKLSPDQEIVANKFIEEKKNVVVLCAGGYGKTYLMKWILLYLASRFGLRSTIVISMTKNSSKSINGKTMHSVFKLQKLGWLIYDMIHLRGEARNNSVSSFIIKYFPDHSDSLDIRDAEYMIFDEVYRRTFGILRPIVPLYILKFFFFY